MSITEEEVKKERLILKKTSHLLDKNIKELEETIKVKLEDLKEFKKLAWKESQTLDVEESTSLREEAETEEARTYKKGEYYKKLKQIEKKPYFASIVFKDSDNEIFNIYISLTYLKDKKLNNILYDWRSPICSLFYDYEVGECSYEAPGGTIKGELKRKRQYKIENNELIGVFDNSLNIDDEFLQSVLAEESSDKMKNVVNTIQQEQNQVIRNLDDNNLIVNGIAGSGKTTVALHRIAFLLYRIKDLSSKDILIFSPNNIFSDYISEVLPSLGESNTLQTTFDDYLSYQLDEYKEIESYTDFVANFYKDYDINKELIKYKQSDRIINDINLYLDNYLVNASFTKNITENIKNKVSKEDLNNYLHNKYYKFPLYERIDEMAQKLSEEFYKGSSKKKEAFTKLLKNSSNFYKPISDIVIDFFKSKYAKINIPDKELKFMFKSKTISYENALIYSYFKGILEGFPYESTIKHVVIDEAQDYNYLQYLIISKIFKKANFTILGDINQNINPYYKYESLDRLKELLEGSTKYIELTKTYRSSPEIIAYTNKILNLNHVSAIRESNNKPIVIRKDIDLKYQLIDDINTLQDTYKKIAVICKDDQECNYIYDLIKDDVNISLLDKDSRVYKDDLIVIPAYLSKGLEFDAVIVYNNRTHPYKKNERNLLYVSCTRAQHELYIYN